MTAQQFDEFYNRMRKAFDIYLKHGDTTRFYNLLPEIKKWYEVKYLPMDKDERTGIETYGYDGNIRGQMSYISDRWACAFRLRWLIDGLEAGLI